MENTGTYYRKPNVGGIRFEADPMNSTYRWEFYLTPGHPRNKVGLMDGYSKGMGFENTNKLILLYKKLVNPVLPYLDRCDRIIVYEQEAGLPKEYHTQLLVLYPHDYSANGWVKQDAFINDFLQRYYTEYVKTGVMPPIEDRRKNVRQTVYMAELDHSKYNFKSMDELRAFCRSKVEKYSAECMHGWYYRHASFQPELFENDTKDALKHVVNTATGSDAAMAAMNVLQSKYSGKP